MGHFYYRKLENVPMVFAECMPARNTGMYESAAFLGFTLTEMPFIFCAGIAFIHCAIRRSIFLTC
jgi:hypothetical protein